MSCEKRSRVDLFRDLVRAQTQRAMRGLRVEPCVQMESPASFQV